MHHLDDENNPFELKSTTRDGVSTARDVGPHTLERWRHRYWLCAKGKNLKGGYVIDEVYILHPSNLEEWLQSLQQRFDSDVSLLERVSSVLMEYHFTTDEVERLRYLVKRGYTLNNPHIPWSYVQTHGTRIEGDSSEYPQRLHEFVQKRPL